MTSLEGILAGSNSGAVVVPGKPDESLVFTLAAHQDTPKMPPNAPKIPQRELAAIASWIKSLPQGEVPESATTASMAKADSEAASAQREDAKNVALREQGLVAIEPITGPLSITALASSRSLVAVSGNHQVLLLDATTRKWLGALNYPEGDVFALKFTADGSRLVAAGGIGGQSGSVVCWELPTYRRLASLPIEGDIVLAMDVTPDGKTVAVGGPKRTIEVIDLLTGTRRFVLRKHADWVTKLAFSGDGVFLASADRFGTVLLWDNHNGDLFENAGSHAGAVTALQFSQDSNQLWTAGKDGQIQRWDLLSNKVDQRWLASDTGVASMILMNDRLFAIDNQQRLTRYSTGGKSQWQRELETEPTSLVAIPTTGQLMVGDIQSGLSMLETSMAHDADLLVLPRKPASFKATRFSPKLVERQLKAPQALEDATALGATPDVALAEARQAIESSRQVIAKTRQHLAELEAKMLELENALEKLKGNAVGQSRRD